MHVSVFRCLLVACLVTGCSDTIDDKGDPWTLGQDMGADTGVDATPDMPDPIDAAPDVRPDMPVDAGAPDVSPDLPDTGSTMVTATGWYTSSFEHSGFLESAPPHIYPLGPGCSPGLLFDPPAENWWLTSTLESFFVNPTMGAFGNAALVTVHGELSPVGEYGHLGNYDREIVIDSYERHGCETAEVLGHCSKPMRNDQCAIPAINSPDVSMTQSLTVTSGGVVAISYFEGRLTFGEEVGDGRSDAVVRWNLDENAAPMQHYAASDLDGLSLTLESHGLFYSETQYEQLDGWIEYSDGAADGWYVSLSGVDPSDPNGPGLHVWGWFAVTDRIAAP